MKRSFLKQAPSDPFPKFEAFKAFHTLIRGAVNAASKKNEFSVEQLNNLNMNYVYSFYNNAAELKFDINIETKRLDMFLAQYEVDNLHDRLFEKLSSSSETGEAFNILTQGIEIKLRALDFHNSLPKLININLFLHNYGDISF